MALAVLLLPTEVYVAQVVQAFHSPGYTFQGSDTAEFENSLKPSVVIKAVLAPLFSKIALVATVVACTTFSMVAGFIEVSLKGVDSVRDATTIVVRRRETFVEERSLESESDNICKRSPMSIPRLNFSTRP
ncbi:MAG: hypothetical protein CM1200mP41_38490 [Gammaproteobacteria bacterium]|nr:MAG: hypothetical protein CM1200mP41_38490 [Gammaproteobacteria bacterium]